MRGQRAARARRGRSRDRKVAPGRGFRARIKPDPHLWIECAGEQFFENTPFYAVIPRCSTRAWVGAGDEGNEERLIQLERSLELAGMKLGGTVPVIAEMLNLPIPEKYHR